MEMYEYIIIFNGSSQIHIFGSKEKVENNYLILYRFTENPFNGVCDNVFYNYKEEEMARFNLNAINAWWNESERKYNMEHRGEMKEND